MRGLKCFKMLDGGLKFRHGVISQQESLNVNGLILYEQHGHTFFNEPDFVLFFKRERR